MKVLVVFDHPRRDSFCCAVADSLMAGLRSAGHVPELADLRRPRLARVEEVLVGLLELRVILEEERVEIGRAHV